MAKAYATFIDARITGNKDSNHIQYVPGYIKPNGTPVKPRVTFSIMVNDGDNDETPKSHKIATFINSPTLVWDMPIGRSVSMSNVIIEQYDTRVFYNNQVLTDPTGAELKVKRVQYKLLNLNDLHLGEHSRKWLDKLAQQAEVEIAQGLRPANWNTPGTPEYRTWRIQQYMKRHRQYTSGETFGFAQVQPIPAGCTLNLTPVSQTLEADATAHVDKQIASMRNGAGTVVAQAQPAGPLPAGPPMVTGVASVQNAFAATVAEPKVDGYTRQQYIGAGWSETQLQANPKFAVFYSASAPPAPAMPAAPGIEDRQGVIVGA